MAIGVDLVILSHGQVARMIPEPSSLHLTSTSCQRKTLSLNSLVVRAPNSRPEGTEYVLVKSVDPKVLWAVAAETRSAGGWRIFSDPPVLCLNCGGEDRYMSPSILQMSNLSQALATFIPSPREEHDDNNKHTQLKFEKTTVR
ncbi:hypothetical protein TNCV_4057101 [Trichonephila clavipes]|nr:hypothetical protein TNCV_4057101 [Trichonephila clavipes]